MGGGRLPPPIHIQDAQGGEKAHSRIREQPPLVQFHGVVEYLATREDRGSRKAARSRGEGLDDQEHDASAGSLRTAGPVRIRRGAQRLGERRRSHGVGLLPRRPRQRPARVADPAFHAERSRRRRLRRRPRRRHLGRPQAGGRATRASIRHGWPSTPSSTSSRISTTGASPSASADWWKSAGSRSSSGSICAVREPRLVWSGEWPPRFGSGLAPRAPSRCHDTPRADRPRRALAARPGGAGRGMPG